MFHHVAEPRDHVDPKLTLYDAYYNLQWSYKTFYGHSQAHVLSYAVKKKTYKEIQ